jgi:hypothetical protein
MTGADEVETDVGSAGAIGLLKEDQLLGGRGGAASALPRPVHPCVAGVEEAALPCRVILSAGHPVLGGRRDRHVGNGVPQPGPQLGPELVLCLAVLEVHRTFLLSSGTTRAAGR